MKRLIKAAAMLVLLTYCVISSALDLREAGLAVPGQADEHHVSLPDTWPAAGGRGVYRLAFDLAALPESQWALRIDRLSSRHRLFLNGRLIHELGEEADSQVRLRLLPLYLPLAPSLLKTGRNELRLELQFGTRAGLSAVQVGPDDELLPLWSRDRWLDTALPQDANIAGGAMACVMLLVWWRRRQERATGLFGLLWLVASLRNHDYFVPVSPLSAGVSDWLYFCAQACTVTLLGLFAVALSGERWPRLQRLYLGGLLGLPLLGLAAEATGLMTPLRLAVYPLLMLSTLGTVRILWQLLQRQRGLALALLLSGAALLVLAGGHDYAYLHGWVRISDFYWMPFAVPFALSCYGAMLLDRLVLGLARSEELSHELELRVAERTAELNEANAAKSRFLAIATHDLRQPVAAIGLLVGLAGEQVQRAHPLAASMLAKAGQAIAGLEALLRGLLDVSRLDINPAAVLHPVPLQPIFDAIALHEQASAQARGLTLRLRATEAVAFSERLLLEQMLRNLVANALRYTERGGVLVAVRRRGAGLRLQVWDTGRGIAPQHRQQIFREFVQGETGTGEGRQGVGLGLAIVERSARALGHALGLQSRVGRGSCFWIDLPRVET